MINLNRMFDGLLFGDVYACDECTQNFAGLLSYTNVLALRAVICQWAFYRLHYWKLLA
jgi:hypothetical protein